MSTANGPAFELHGYFNPIPRRMLVAAYAIRRWQN
jgi:hypothetical protein